MFKRLKTGLAAAAACGLLACSVSAATIIGATSVTSPQGDFGGPFALDNAINQSGLSATYTSGATDFSSYVLGTTHDGTGSLNSGFTNDDELPQIFSFDLGSVVTLTGLAFWATDNIGSVTGFRLYSDSDQDYGNGVGTLLGSFAVSGQAAIASADVRSFGAASTQFLQLEVTSPPSLFTGIGEIAFRSVALSAVPVPSSLPLLSLGIGAFGWQRMRRRKG